MARLPRKAHHVVEQRSEKPLTPSTRRGNKRHWYSLSSGSSSTEEELVWDALDIVEGRKTKSPKKIKLQPSAEAAAAMNNRWGLSELFLGPLVELDATLMLKLPIEIHQKICGYLPTNGDVANYSRICKTTYKSVTWSAWRERFLLQFDDFREDKAALPLYFERLKKYFRVTKTPTSFDLGPRLSDSPKEYRNELLQVLKSLILDSNAKLVIDQHGFEVVEGKNLDYIEFLCCGNGSRRFQTITNIADVLCDTNRLFTSERQLTNKSPHSIVLILQLCLLHLVLHPATCKGRPVYFPKSQSMVYSCMNKQRIFSGKNGASDLNFVWLLHCASFWKYHLKAHDEGVLAHSYHRLSPKQLPRAWTGRFQADTQSLAKRWKGCYAYLGATDLINLRQSSRRSYVDEASEGNDGFQDLSLFFDIEGCPELQADSHLEALESAPKGPLDDFCTGQPFTPKVLDFVGLGKDRNIYHVKGRVHAIPPQQGIPGFQRISMVKYMPNQLRNGVWEMTHWAYEGCVLPGGNIMLGRWWSITQFGTAHTPSYCGPFIYWKVQESEKDKMANASLVLRFLACQRASLGLSY